MTVMPAVTLTAAIVAVDQATKTTYDGPVHASLATTGYDTTQTPVQLAAGIVLCAWLIPFAWRHAPWWVAALVAGGLLSNLFDRLVHGGVRNPIAYGPAWWNLADPIALVGVCLTIGYALEDQLAHYRKGGTHDPSPDGEGPGHVGRRVRDLVRRVRSPLHAVSEPAGPGASPHRARPTQSEEEPVTIARIVRCARCAIGKVQSRGLCGRCLADDFNATRTPSTDRR